MQLEFTPCEYIEFIDFGLFGLCEIQVIVRYVR